MWPCIVKWTLMVLFFVAILKKKKLQMNILEMAWSFVVKFFEQIQGYL